MNKETIKICGKDVPVKFTLGTLFYYEDIVGESFFGEDFILIRKRVALVSAAILTADPETDIKYEDIVKSENFDEFNNAFMKISEMVDKFFKKPKVVSDAEAEENKNIKEEEKEKN